MSGGGLGAYARKIRYDIDRDGFWQQWFHMFYRDHVFVGCNTGTCVGKVRGNASITIYADGIVIDTDGVTIDTDGVTIKRTALP
jgi:hypothetical protein